MPYVPRFGHLLKITFRVRDQAAAEGLWYEGTWLSENGDDAGALLAFAHACALDREFAGAYYNYAALTEKRYGVDRRTLKAWEEYAAVAKRDPRQPRDTVERVAGHITELREKLTIRSS